MHPEYDDPWTPSRMLTECYDAVRSLQRLDILSAATMQASLCVPQDKEEARLPTLVLTAPSAVTDPVKVHACQPTHWFSKLLCYSTMSVWLEMTPSMLPGVEYLAILPTRFCIPTG